VGSSREIRGKYDLSTGGSWGDGNGFRHSLDLGTL